MVPPLHGMPIVPIDPAGVEHRRAVEERAGLGEEAEHEPEAVHVQRLAPLGVHDAFGQPRRAAGVHEHGQIVLGDVDDGGRAGPDDLVVTHVVGDVAITDQHDRLQRGQVGAQPFGDRGVVGVDVEHLGARVGEDEPELLRRQAVVQRVDDAAAEERRVPQVDVVPAVAGEHGEAVVTGHPEAGAVGIGQPERTIDVIGEQLGGPVVVDERRPVAAPLCSRQQQPRVDQFVHAAIIVAGSPPLRARRRGR